MRSSRNALSFFSAHPLLSGAAAAVTASGLVGLEPSGDWPVAVGSKRYRGRLLARAVGSEILIINGLYPRSSSGEPTGGNAAGTAAIDIFRQRSRLHERERKRLSRRWPGDRIELPLLPIDRGPDLVAALSELLARELGREPAPS